MKQKKDKMQFHVSICHWKTGLKKQETPDQCSVLIKATHYLKHNNALSCQAIMFVRILPMVVFLT